MSKSKEKNVYQRGDGRWEARTKNVSDDIRDIENGLKPKYKSFYGQTKEEAIQKRQEYLLANGADQKALFKDVCNAWLLMKTGKVKQSSLETYRANMEIYLIPYFGSKKFKDVARNDQEDAYTEYLLKERKLAKKFVGSQISLYRSIITWYENKPKREIMRDARPVPEEDFYFSIEQVQLIRQSLSIKDLDVAILLYTGMNIGELCALDWNDVNLGNRTIKVNKTVQRIKAPDGETSKTRLSETKIEERAIPISEVLMVYLQVCPKGKRHGKVIGEEPRAVQLRLDTFFKGIGLKGSPKKLRNTFCVHAILNGKNPMLLAKVIGINAESFERAYRKYINIYADTAELQETVEAIFK